MKRTKRRLLIPSAWLFMPAGAQAVQPEVLYAFQAASPEPANANGANPLGGLALGSDGDFYGATSGGGGNGVGTVFKVTTNGAFSSLASFDGGNGARPEAKLTSGKDGHFYGTTSGGGSNGIGTVFRVTTNGILTSLVSFNDTNGANPRAGLVFGSDGNLYGTTERGGVNGAGTVFKVTTNGVLTTLVSLSRADGLFPSASPSARLALGSDGNFYGTTRGDLRHMIFGTVFTMTANGALTTLVSFSYDNGFFSQAELVLGRDGCFYGTTDSTVFRVTTNGVLTTLAWFNGANGAEPNELTLGSDGYFYGTTRSGGSGGGGTIFRLVISEFTTVVRQQDGRMSFTGTGPPNGGYRLWASIDVSLPVSSWTLLTSASFDSNGNFSYADAGTASHSSRFYQLSVP